MQTGNLYATNKSTMAGIHHNGRCPSTEGGVSCKGVLELTYYKWDPVPAKTVLEYQCQGTAKGHVVQLFPRGVGTVAVAEGT